MKECLEYIELISAQLDGTLTAEDEARLTAHLEMCPECRALLEDLARMKSDLSIQMGAPAGFADRVMEQCDPKDQEIPFTALERNRKVSGKNQTKQWWRPIRNWGALAACCLLIFGLGKFVGNNFLRMGSGAPVQNEAAMCEEDACEETAEVAAPSAEAPESAMMSDTMTESTRLPEEAAGAAAEDKASIYGAEPYEAIEESTDMAVDTEAAAPSAELEIDGEVYHCTNSLSDELPEGAEEFGEYSGFLCYSDPCEPDWIWVRQDPGYELWCKD